MGFRVLGYPTPKPEVGYIQDLGSRRFRDMGPSVSRGFQLSTFRNRLWSSELMGLGLLLLPF